MRNSILSVSLLAMFFVFTSCSSDDDSSSSNNNDCLVCELELFGQSTSTEYCDNGDGTVTVNGEGTEDLEGVSFSDFISAQEEFLGATCN
ncbi:hypothetical protein [Psychroflexus salis]|mgnify:CR=1 FL=1|uniref:Uncharacterized protein n=1 Tax=Psychroflexus salis TaxID=1526574 RepID=A0A917E982_9FLAO|nr:hypothetical protein [Psychroflexus salis]GGE11790.1 hypothetical protein GCM10010831_11570 [Psychroflexus salis]